MAGINVLEQVQRGQDIDEIMQELVDQMEKSKFDLGLQQDQITSNEQLIKEIQAENQSSSRLQMQKAENIMRGTVSTGRNLRAPARIRNRI